MSMKGTIPFSHHGSASAALAVVAVNQTKHRKPQVEVLREQRSLTVDWEPG